MPQVPYLNNPSIQLIRDRFETAQVFNAENETAWQRSCGNLRMITQGSESFTAHEHLRTRDIAVLGAGSHVRLKRILDYNDTLEEKMCGIILSCATSKMPDSETIEMIEKSGIPAFAVPQDAGSIDQLVYKAFKNTKLQLYDRNKHRKVKNLFAEHFDSERFIETIGL